MAKTFTIQDFFSRFPTDADCLDHLMKVRYGEDCAGSFEPLDFGVPLQIDDVTITLVPAGHVLGS
ncbi:MAG: hypothetical protein H7X74_04680, partial [Methyloceanibacter sp.]|nr:hypothetical protein [Methyloceanibacter sp.]